MSSGGRSPLGIQLARAERYSIDSTGKRLRPIPPKDYGGVRVKETRRHALSGGVNSSQEEELVREGIRARIEASLTELEAQVLRLQGKLTIVDEDRRRVPAGDVAFYIRGGYTYVPGSDREEERDGLPTITTVEVVGEIEQQVESLNHAEVAERLQLSTRQVRRLIESANRKLRALGRVR